MKRLVIGAIAALASWSSPSTPFAQQPLVIKPLAEKKVAELPAGPLFWRIENVQLHCVTLAQAQAAVGPYTLVAESAGKVWLFTLGPPGSTASAHTHPGFEAFYVLAGEQSIRSPRGVTRVRVGRPEAGPGADVPMQVSSSGSTDLRSLAMFVVDATRPFASPAKLP